jgi:hypothetical protein
VFQLLDLLLDLALPVIAEDSISFEKTDQRKADGDSSKA